MSGAAAEDGHIRLLAAEVERLHNAVAHLVASNAELKQAIEEEGDDEDRTFKTAIQENIVVIAKYRAQAERLEKELAELRGGRQHLGAAQAIPTQEAAAPQPAAAAPKQQQQQQQANTGAGQGADATMVEAGGGQQEQEQEQQQTAHAAQQPETAGGGGMWM